MKQNAYCNRVNILAEKKKKKKKKMVFSMRFKINSVYNNDRQNIRKCIKLVSCLYPDIIGTATEIEQIKYFLSDYTVDVLVQIYTLTCILHSNSSKK